MLKFCLKYAIIIYSAITNIVALREIVLKHIILTKLKIIIIEEFERRGHITLISSYQYQQKINQIKI